MKNLSYIGLIIILIVFGLLFIPKIVDRVANNTQVESNRSVPAKPLAYIKLNGEAKKVPEFLMRNQDSLLIGYNIIDDGNGLPIRAEHSKKAKISLVRNM